jgi:hypothetical protein
LNFLRTEFPFDRLLFAGAGFRLSRLGEAEGDGEGTADGDGSGVGLTVGLATAAASGTELRDLRAIAKPSAITTTIAAATSRNFFAD